MGVAVADDQGRADAERPVGQRLGAGGEQAFFEAQPAVIQLLDTPGAKQDALVQVTGGIENLRRAGAQVEDDAVPGQAPATLGVEHVAPGLTLAEPAVIDQMVRLQQDAGAAKGDVAGQLEAVAGERPQRIRLGIEVIVGTDGRRQGLGRQGCRQQAGRQQQGGGQERSAPHAMVIPA